MGYFDRNWQLPGEETPQAQPQGAALVPAAAPVVLTQTIAAAATTLPPPASTSTGSTTPLPPPAQPEQLASSANTQAGRAARQIARIVPTFMNYRARIPLATWTLDPIAAWSIRDNARCLAELEALGIQVQPHEAELSTPVPAPVEVTAPVDGVQFHMVHQNRKLLMSCRWPRGYRRSPRR